MKKVLIQFNLKGFSVKKYDQTWDELRKAGFSNPKGLIHHTGAQNGDDLIVSDVWESEEAFKKFGETLMPIMAKMGVTNPVPMILPVHYDYQAAHYEYQTK
jgi:hypothetical protein